MASAEDIDALNGILLLNLGNSPMQQPSWLRSVDIVAAGLSHTDIDSLARTEEQAARCSRSGERSAHPRGRCPTPRGNF
jgi:hypothetical protein